MYSDPSGNFAITSFLIGMGIAALIGTGVGAVSYTASEVISYGLTGEWSWSWGAFAGSTIGGGITGALAFAFPVLGIMGSAGINGFLSNSLGMVFQKCIWRDKLFDWEYIFSITNNDWIININSRNYK